MNPGARSKTTAGIRAVVAAALVATTLPIFTSTVEAATDDLLISEYVEGSSLNKAVEIYNGTGAPVDLAAGSYQLEIFFNGNTSAGATIALAGTVADGDVFVVADDGADPDILAEADLTPTNSFFNGDDAVVLTKAGAVIDAFGQVGVDPGSEWPGGGANDTLRRNADVCEGDTNSTDAFDASVEYAAFASNTFDGLGTHVADCDTGGGDPVIVVSEIMYNPASAEDAWEWVEIANTGGSTADLTGWVIDDNNSVAHTEANIAAGSVSAGGSAVLFNADDVTAADFTAAWGTAVNLVAVTNWSAMALNNGGDTVGLWSDFASYDGDNQTQANVVVNVAYDDANGWPSDDGAGSIFLTDLAADSANGANWALSTVGATTPVNDAYQSISQGGNSGGDVGSPSVEPAVVDPIGECFEPATFIHEVQGDGPASPLVGQDHTIEGVVVGDFQDGVGANGDLNGFHVQEEDADADGNPLTSEGVFVFDGSNPAVDVSVGDVVRVRGTVVEFNGETQISAATVLGCAAGATAPTPVDVTLPVTAIGDFEAFEGMSIVLPQSLTIAEYFNFDRFNETVLTIDRPFQPTAIHEPGSPEAAALADLNARSRITLDDGRTASNPDPAIHQNGAEFTLDNRFRGGDLVADTVGVMGYSFGLYRVQPTAGADYAVTNPRPPAPDPVGGSLEVGAFNVLNYFNTLDYPSSDPRDNACGPNQDQGCRGADNEDERIRQLDKIVAAIDDVDADVLGIIEVENTAGVEALADIVDGLNAATAPGTYAYLDTGLVGDDVIKVGFLYQPAAVTPTGDFAVLDDPAFVAPFGVDRNRAALAQTFVENATGGKFTAVVNHLKSKGSPCGPGDDGPETGSCNLTRSVAAHELADWLATDPTGSGDPDVMIVGDLNSYAKEDPIDVLAGEGYVDLLGQFQGDTAYTFVFSGQFGYLDYLMASESLAAQVTGATAWHSNADEPDILDYDTSFKQPPQQALYEPNAFRASDHDPVIAGLDLTVAPRALKANARDLLVELLPTDSRADDRSIDKAIQRIDQSLNPDWWIDDTTLDPKLGKKVFDREYQAAKALERVYTVDVQPAIDLLIEADRELATTQLQIAIDAGADQHDIDQVQHLLDKAEDYVDYGWYAKSIQAFRNAWREAVKATPEPPVRFATFNASLNRNNEGDLAAELSAPGSAQPDVIAEIIQRSRPEVLLINEFDYDDGNVALNGFHDNYLMVPHGDAEPIEYPYRYTAPSNTGIFSGFDLDNSGAAGDFVPNDSFGFGFFEGQFGMAVYSMYPIEFDEIRTFQNFLWKDMPGALLPVDPGPPATPWYSDEELEVFRLSSKSHWDVPIDVDGTTVHFLVSHPTPPVFDGPEDRNGTRNHDEIRFWADYVTGGAEARYIYDDDGKKGGLRRNADFVIAGDQNSDPLDGDSIPGAVDQLLDHPKVNTSVTPSSPGGSEQSALQGGANDTHLSDPAFDTADFRDDAPGNLRVDYVLPSTDLPIRDAGVFWPLANDPLFSLVGTFPFPSSDHKLVWVDVGVS